MPPGTRTCACVRACPYSLGHTDLSSSSSPHRRFRHLVPVCPVWPAALPVLTGQRAAGPSRLSSSVLVRSRYGCQGYHKRSLLSQLCHSRRGAARILHTFLLPPACACRQENGPAWKYGVNGGREEVTPPAGPQVAPRRRALHIQHVCPSSRFRRLMLRTTSIGWLCRKRVSFFISNSHGIVAIGVLSRHQLHN